MKNFRSLALPIIVVLIWTLVKTDVTSAQQAQSGNATRLLHDQLKNLLQGSPKPHELKCIVCADIHDKVDECRDVAEIRRCLAGGSTPVSGKRKKRHANRYWIPFTWNNFPSFPRFQTLSPISDEGGPVICPQQAPQSYPYTLSADSNSYPAEDMAFELSINPLAGCLSQQVVLVGDYPPLFYDGFIQNSSYTCPFVELRLWSYYSTNSRSRCWVMQTFQQDIKYKICGIKFCQNCDEPSRSHSPSHSFPSHEVLQNLCTTEYREVSLWSFCPDLIIGQRIVWDRIIIPVSCNCQEVHCSRA